MNTNFTPPTSATTNPEFGTVAALLVALSDPATHKSRLDALVAATDKFNAAKAGSEASLKALNDETEAARKSIEADRAAAAKSIQMDRLRFEVDTAAIKQRSDAVDKRSAELDQTAAALAIRDTEISRRETVFRRLADDAQRLATG